MLRQASGTYTEQQFKEETTDLFFKRESGVYGFLEALLQVTVMTMAGIMGGLILESITISAIDSL